MDQILGTGNGFAQYLLALIAYAGFYVVIRYASGQVTPDFRKTFWVLYIAWGLNIFIGNFVFYLLGIMSFYPWLNNAIHCFLWIGFGLGTLFAGSYRHPMWVQFVLFATLSFAIKVIEQRVLGTWEFDRFFFIQGNLAYLIGWSVVDGFYPVLSTIGLRLASRFVKGLVVS